MLSPKSITLIGARRNDATRMRLAYNTRGVLWTRMQAEWTEKYRPKSLSGIVGNEEAARALRRWADSWSRGKPSRKAVVLRGDPGIGKTSAALALANDMGWDFIEMNASDHRNALSIKKVAGAGALSQTFSATGEFFSSTDDKRKLVILDEADNLFGNEDRGGSKAIVETIRESSQPMILIVNDYRELTRKASAIKSLAERVQFNRLSQRDIVKVLRDIAEKEKVRAPSEVLEHVAENANGDLRAAINDLQMIVEGKAVLVEKDSEVVGKRNQLKELEIGLREMFSADSVKGARNATMDIDLTPDDLEKWIEESIPQEMRSPEDLAAAFEALSRSDIYLGRTRRLQYYALWSYAKEMMTGGVVLARKHGPRPQVAEHRFPGHFIVMSRAKGPRAARKAIATKLAPHLHTSRRVLIGTVLPLLSVMVRNDRELLLHLIGELEFDEGDVAYLLGTDPDDKSVTRAILEAKGDLEDSAASGKARSSGRPRRSTSPF